MAAAAVPAPANPAGSTTSQDRQEPLPFLGDDRSSPAPLPRCATVRAAAPHRAAAPQPDADGLCAPLSARAETRSGSPPTAPPARLSPLPADRRAAADAKG